jgi:[ribosomal protein S5]-alanine N-acetyltransferase
MLREQDILLRPLTDDDKTAMAKLLNNKKVWDNLRDYIPYPYSESDAQFFIDLVKIEKPQMTFSIDFKEEFCGIIGLVGQKDVYQKTAEIGYWIGEPFWNKGIATTAVKLITEYGLNQLNFIRIHTGVFEYNLGSMKVLEKNGYEKDGIFKKSVFKNGKVWNEHRYSKIK